MRPLHEIHFFQDSTYIDLRSDTRWEPERVELIKNAQIIGSAVILHRKLRLFSARVSMIMFGPNINYKNEAGVQDFLKYVISEVRKSGSIYLAIQPYVLSTPRLLENFLNAGFKRRNEYILYPNTSLIDLSNSEEDIFASFDGNIRTALRKAGKSSIEIRINEGPQCVEIFYDLYKQAYQRGGGGYQTRDYFQKVWKGLAHKSEALFGIAYVDKKPVTGLLNVLIGGNMVYLSGGSMYDEVLLKNRPNEKLHWEMIRLAKKWGCLFYDMGGVNPAPVIGSKSAGIAHFKRQFAKEVKPLLGYFRYSYNPHYVEMVDLLLPFISKIRNIISTTEETEYNLM